MAVSSQEDLQSLYDNLESNVPKVYEPYPVKRKKLAVKIKEIQELMDDKQWPFWDSWKQWDFMRTPITYCFQCMWPVRLKPKVSEQGTLQQLQCTLCELIHWDVKHD